jgi:hypothetical protein
MSALVASRHKPILKALYQRLLDAGKPKKLALDPGLSTLDSRFGFFAPLMIHFFNQLVLLFKNGLGAVLF